MSDVHLLQNILQDNVGLCKSHATRLAKEGEIESIMKEFTDWREGGKEQENLRRERIRTMAIAKRYDEMEKAIVELEKTLSSSSSSHQYDGIDVDVDVDGEGEDYTSSLTRQMKELRQLEMHLEALGSKRSKEEMMTNDSSCKHESEIRAMFGMPRINKPEGDQSYEDYYGLEEGEILENDGDYDDDDGDDDDDVPTVVARGVSGTSLIVCPLTTKLLEDPVKNTICGHAYSREAILVHLQISKKCPVAGCANRRVLTCHLKPDVEITQLVRRHKRRLDAQREYNQIHDNTDDDDDDDEEEEEEEEEEI